MIRRLSVLIMSIGVIFALVLAPTASSADEATPNPVTKIVQKVKDLVQPKNIQAAVDAPPATEDDDIPPNETEDPVGPDHASTQGLNATLGGNSLAGLNQNNATIEDDDSTHADSAALTVLGTNLFGASASSDGTTYERNEPLGIVLDALCTASVNNICVDLLYSEAHATQTAGESHAHAESGILNACLFGGGLALPGGGVGGAGGLGSMATQDEEPPAACEGLLGAGVAESRAEINRDRTTGQTVAEAFDFTAGACVLPGCALPVSALFSGGFADSGTGAGDEVAERGSFLLLLGDDGFFLADPFAIPLSPVLALFFNQGESYVAPGTAGTAQDALRLKVLTDVVPLVGVDAGHTETLAHNDGRNADDEDENDENDEEDENDENDEEDENDENDEEDENDENDEEDENDENDESDEDEDEDSDEDEDEDSDSDEDGDDNALPGTGGPSSALLALGLLGVGLGSATIAYGRRPRSVRQQG